MRGVGGVPGAASQRSESYSSILAQSAPRLIVPLQMAVSNKNSKSVSNKNSNVMDLNDIAQC